MKRTAIALGAAVLLAFAGATAASAGELSGVLSVNVGVAALDSDDSQFDEDSYFTFGGNARVSSQNWIVEGFATSIAGTDEDDGDDEEGSVSFGLAGHYVRQPSDRVTYGVFLGVQHTTFQDDEDTAYHAFGGVEGAYNWDQTTLFGQAGYSSNLSDDDDTWDSGPFVRAGVRYFPDENKKIEADIAAGWGEYNASDDGNHYSWGLEYEHQLNGGPYSVEISYRGYYTENSSSPVTSFDEARDDVFSIALRVSLNGGSVRDRHRNGADRFEVPDFHRAYSYPEEL